jgi:phosphoglycolate phosphatase
MQLLFDLDGTLTDSSVGIVRCFEHALRAVGSSVTDVPPPVVIGPPLAIAFRELLRSDESLLIDEAIAAYRVRYEAAGMFENALYAGVVGALDELRSRGHRMRVVTVKPRPYADRILRHFGIEHFFDAVHGPTLADRSHTKARLIDEALSDSASSHAVMVGDRAEDIRAARAHGIPAIAVRWGYGSEEELSEAEPIYIADTIEDVVKWITALDQPLTAPPAR